MQAFQSVCSPSTTSLKRRSRSPSPQSNKRRVPASYAPTLYANLQPPSTRSLSVEAVASGTPASERSSPGLDWLQRTQDLHLQTPPIHTPANLPTHEAMDQDVGVDGGGGGEHAMRDDSPVSSYVPHPAAPFSTHASAHPPSSSFPPLYHPAPSRAPHDAPPLHQHLAGSPQQSGAHHFDGAGAGGGRGEVMSRSSSNSSVQSMLSATAAVAGSVPSFAFPHAPAVAPHAQPRDETMHAEPHVSPLKKAAEGGGGGWKVTMGYRADCLKCQQREPGHYSHVVYTS
ncbi:hypothetical protein Rhopal_001686-T1 [Rhodotorula paludigena]|uniref:Uncharacterized protein n=1 Tax=Rhodotorula paludigena TaxID=86838 RepID=A0AAV5GG31_9BASI|nr:hypothetical protein Rhopal_001686-T1 [Rhodotorula paludigena]